MRKIFLASILLCARSISPGLAGSDDQGWIWQYPNPPGNTLRAVCASPQAWIAVGDYGTITRSTDEGLSWSFVPNAYSQHIQGVCHVGNSR
jgi:photosystem II stability/assembly factor-like uncharacterized protein